ncbi:MAG TPA: hypothetical protein VEI52_04615 [Terriglobales bacterium]|nr:hypothetical protein [Terriglobales bacterium]
MQLSKLTELKVKDVRLKQERKNESLRLAELMKRLQRIIRQREQSTGQRAA